MRKIPSVFAPLLLFLVVMLTAPFANFAIANWIAAPAIEIKSPFPYFDKIYQNSTVELKIEVRVLTNTSAITRISYSLNGNDNITLTNISKSKELTFSSGNGFSYSAGTNLTNLSNGDHTIRAYSLDSQGREMAISVTFTVDTTFRTPAISIISPLNQSYSTNQILLTYCINGTAKYSYYSLDSSGDKTFSGNITLTNLQEGSHAIKVTVLTDGNYYAQQTAYFNVSLRQTDNPSTPNSQTNKTAMAMLAGIVIVIAVILTVILFKQMKK